jgi:hypothetical protein
MNVAHFFFKERRTCIKSYHSTSSITLEKNLKSLHLKKILEVMVCVPAPPDSRGVRVAGSGFSVATLAAQNPAAFPVVSPGQENAGQAPLGQFLVPFGSPRNAELQPQSLRFPRGRKPRVIRPGALPCPLSHVLRVCDASRIAAPPRLRLD